MKNSLDEFNTRISDFEDRSIETVPSEEQREKYWWKTNTAPEIGDISNISLYVQIGPLEKKKKKKEAGKNIWGNKVKNFPHLVILTGTSKKYHIPQIGCTQEKHIIVNLLKAKNKEKS